MDWISTTTACFATSNAIAKTSIDLHAFIREVRESRHEMDAMAGVLHSLDRVLDLLKDDAASFPPELAHRTPELVERCADIVNEVHGFISILNGSGFSKQDKRARWVATRRDLEKLRSTLEAYKATIGLAVDLVGLTSTNDSTSEASQPTSPASETPSTSGRLHDPASRSEMSRLVAEVGLLSAKLQEEARMNGAISGVRGYLVVLQAYAGNMAVAGCKSPQTANSISDASDSAIEMGEESAVLAMQRSPQDPGLPIEDIDELLDELAEMRPPTPPPMVPPKAPARANSERSSVISPVERHSTPDSGESITTTPTGSNSGQGLQEDAAGIETQPETTEDRPQVPERLSSLTRNARFNSSLSPYSSVVTKITSETGSLASSNKTKRFSRMFGHMRNNSGDVSQSSLGATLRPSTSSDRTDSGSLTRRGTRRLSTALKFIPLWRTEERPEEDVAADMEPNAVFGVSLRKSIQVAQGNARTHHNDGSSKSRRQFPLCMLKCVTYLNQRAVETPHLFGESGDMDRVIKLKERFSHGPRYGDDVNLMEFGHYEVADLVLLYLTQLPKPLIGEAVAKKWVGMSKQATQTGSHGQRLDGCIDFWEEALEGIRDPARSLFKLLLNLWGDVADAAQVNEMTAERLAGCVLKPLLHIRGYDTDHMLALAFLIRKRSEYMMLLQGSGRKSNAAF